VSDVHSIPFGAPDRHVRRAATCCSAFLHPGKPDRRNRRAGFAARLLFFHHPGTARPSRRIDLMRGRFARGAIFPWVTYGISEFQGGAADGGARHV
jgi:hypothetical protein